MLCITCATPPGWSKATIFVGFYWLMGALGCLLILRAGPAWEMPGFLLLLMASIIALTHLRTAIHEFGHAVAGALVGRKIIEIRIGTGRPIATIRVAKTEISLRLSPNGGWIRGLPRDGEGRLQYSFYLLGGALANLTAAVILVVLAGKVGEMSTSKGASIFVVVALGLAIANLIGGFSAFRSRTSLRDGIQVTSDGLKLRELWSPDNTAEKPPVYAPEGVLLMREGRWAEARESYEAALTSDPKQIGLLGFLLHVIGQAEGSEAAFDYYLAHPEMFNQTPDAADQLWAFAWANAAWFGLETNNPEHLLRVEDLSKRAIAADPTSATIRAVRGATMMATGEREAGHEILSAALREIEDRPFKIGLCQFLARDAEHLGESENFREYSSLAAYLQNLEANQPRQRAA